MKKLKASRQAAGVRPAAAWRAGMTLAGYLWARALYNRRPAR